MSHKTYSNVLTPTATPQSEPIFGKNMVQNNAGGYTFSLDSFGQLDRFLILGTEGGTYYAGENSHTLQATKGVLKAIELDGIRVVNRVVEISKAGRAPKNDPALFVLALAMTYGNNETKKLAFSVIPEVARIGTHLFHLAQYVNEMRGWGRGLRNAFANWYNSKTPIQLARQVTKYANRDGWTHADILRLSHAVPSTPSHDALFSHVVGKAKEIHNVDESVINYMAAVEEILHTDSVKRTVELITEFSLPREVVRSEMLTRPEVWDALLPSMKLEAMIRNLATMTRVGLISPNSTAKGFILGRIQDQESLLQDRIHPIKILTALNTYALGRSIRGENTWKADRAIVDALDAAFYLAFENVDPTNARYLLGLDISSSMTSGEIAGMPGITPRVAEAAMAMLTVQREYQVEMMGFSTRFVKVEFSKKDRLDEVSRKIGNFPHGGTDCSLPMVWALNNKVPVDVFVVYTDNETWAGRSHPVQALQKYRDAMGIPAKMIVVGFTATSFTIADPTDGGMMDVVGFDTAAPQVMNDFIVG